MHELVFGLKHSYHMLNEITGGAEPGHAFEAGTLSAVDTLLMTSSCFADAEKPGATHVGI